MNTFGQTPSTTAKVLLNQAMYGFIRTVANPPPEGWLHSRWHWYRAPFSLRGEVLWSAPLASWFRAQDESAIECMLHLSDYEPVGWVAPKLGDVFLDVGAYIGWYAIRAAKAVGHLGKVIALEPDGYNRRQLEQNLALNHISNCEAIPIAAWFESAVIGWRSDEVPVWSQVQEVSGTGSVQARTIDSVVSDLGITRLSWIKMDIEGAEVEALHGSRQVLRRYRPALFIEIHDTLEIVSRFLGECGYLIEKSRFDQPRHRHGWILARCL
jgi:FkbM family methyltransferase